MWNITRKTFLAKNLKRFAKLFPLEYDFFPQTWILPTEHAELRAYIDKCNKARKAQQKKDKQAALLIQAQSVAENSIEPSDQPVVASAFSKMDKVASPKQTIVTFDGVKTKDLTTVKKELRKHRADDEHNILKDEFDSDSDKLPSKIKKKKKRRANFTMIVKPDCLSQGKGIFLTHDLD
jgi:hypothetical protein